MKGVDIKIMRGEIVNIRISVVTTLFAILLSGVGAGDVKSGLPDDIKDQVLSEGKKQLDEAKKKAADAAASAGAGAIAEAAGKVASDAKDTAAGMLAGLADGAKEKLAAKAGEVAAKAQAEAAAKAAEASDKLGKALPGVAGVMEGAKDLGTKALEQKPEAAKTDDKKSK